MKYMFFSGVRLLRRFVSLVIILLLFSLSPCVSGYSSLLANPFSGGQNKLKIEPPPVRSGGFEKCIQLQFEFRDKMASAIRDIKKGGPGNALFLFLAASFLYGLFHAAGPGHRKTVIFSLFLSRRSGWYEPGCAGFISAAVHAGTSIAVIMILFIVQKTVVSVSASDNIYAAMEGLTFVIMALFSLYFIIGITVRLMRQEKPAEPHNERGLYPLVIIASFVPCPGAAMLMVLALYSGLPGTGIAGVAAMSAGMGVVISLAGYLAYTGRAGLFLKFKKNERVMSIVSSLLELVSFIIIMLFSVFMAWPFVRSVLL